MSKSLYSGVNKVYFRSYLLLNIVASSAYISPNFGNFWKQYYGLGQACQTGGPIACPMRPEVIFYKQKIT